MNWEAMGAVGEILGATVVFITLDYLAIQVRYAKLAAADANRLARARGVNDMQLAQLANRDAFLAAAKANGTEAYYRELAAEFDLTYEQALDVDGQCVYWFWLHWGQYRSHNAPEDVEELGQTIGKFYNLPANRYCWNNSPYGKTLLEESFVRFVDDNMARWRDREGLYSA
jgi:hypothetical protein